jgi:hypothetical protein
MSAIDGMAKLGFVERFVYRQAIAPTQQALREQSERSRGSGRVHRGAPDASTRSIRTRRSSSVWT